ncbi:replication protein A 70 kDa DNA-binding subunit B [Tanacetum coccineum]
MELNLMNVTQLCNIDPMIDDLKVLGRCISLWKSHHVGGSNDVWALDMVFQDAQFEAFANFSTKQFSPSDVVDVIGTVVSMTDCIPFNNFGVDKIRRTLILEDVDGVKLECCFFDAWAKKFDNFSYLIYIRYIAEKPSVSNAIFSTKLFINDDIPEVAAFRQRKLLSQKGVAASEGESSSLGNGKRAIIDLDDYNKKEEQAKKGKMIPKVKTERDE